MSSTADFALTDFGALADGRDAQFLASWETGAPRLRLCAAIARASVAGDGAVLRLDDLEAGRFFEHADIGLPIHVPNAGPGGDGLTTRIARVLDSRSVVLADPAQPPPQAPLRIVWPCFMPQDAGKTLWIEGGADFVPRSTRAGTRQHVMNDGAPLPLQARIAAVFGPGDVALALEPSAPGGADVPQRVVWGTENSAALLRAGEAAIAARAGILHFPRGLLCAFGAVQDLFAPAPPFPGIGRVFGLLRWLGDDADAFVTDIAGSVLFVRPSPRTPRPFAPPPRGVAGRAHLPRFAAAPRPVVVIAGDSMTTAEVWNGSPRSAASSPLGGLIAAIREQNPGKNCWFVDRSVPGGTWDTLDHRQSNTIGWYAEPRKAWLDYVRSVPGGDGAAVSPDLVILGIGGGNDAGSVSLSAMESVIAKVRAMPPDADGRPPDILLMNGRPSARWSRAGQGDAAGMPHGNFWAFQVAREVPHMLHRSFAALRGVGFLDYEDVAQRALWGWSFLRSTLRRVPDTDMQQCSRATPLSFRRRCRDFSFYLTLPGDSGAAAWGGVGSLAVQIGSRQDNVAVIGSDAAGRLTLQINAWGGTTTADAQLGRGGRLLETGGDRGTAGLRWHMRPGGTVLLARQGPWPFSAADIGKCILVPGVGRRGTDLRSTIVAVSTAPDALYLADTATSDVKISDQPLRWGGTLFVPQDAAARVDLLFPAAAPDGSDLTARVAEHLGPTRVVLDRPIGLAENGANRIFVGRIALPRRTLPLAAAADPSPNPRLHLYVKGTQLFVGLFTAATRVLEPGYSGPCLRYGGPFLPRITPATDRPVRLRATECYIDEAMIEGQILTDAEMWGGMWDHTALGPWDGNGMTHTTHRQFAAVDVPLLRAQDFST